MMQLPWWFWASHILLVPLYVAIGKTKHEIAHAVAAIVAGLTITDIKIFPLIEKGKLSFGYVLWDLPAGMTRTPKYVLMMPYYIDVPLWGLGMWWTFNSGIDWPSLPPLEACYKLSAILGILVIGTMLDLAYNAYKYVAQNRGDFAEVAKR